MRSPFHPLSSHSRRSFSLFLSLCLAFICSVLGHVADVRAAISSAGDIAPVPPAAGGAIAGPFRIGNVDVGTMSITGGTALTNTGPAVLGDTVIGLGIVNMSGFGSDWTLTTAGADFTIGINGTGSLSLSNLAFLSVNDDFFMAAQLNSLGEMSISGLGTIVDVGDDANIGQRGQAVIDISNGGRLVTDANIIGDEAAGDGRVIVSDQFSMWRAFSTMTVADAGRGLLQIFDGARVENTGGVVANQAGSTGTVEVVGLGSLWQNELNLLVGEFGHGRLFVRDGGRVVNGGGANSLLIGRQLGSIGEVEVRGLDSQITVSLMDVGDSGTGTLRILEGGRVHSGITVLGDNTTARGVALVDGAGSIWEISGALDVADAGEAHLTISNSGLVRTTSVSRVGALGRLSLDGGRLEALTTPFQNNGVVDGNGTIDVVTANNNLGAWIRPWGAEPLLFTGTLNNSGIIDVQSGILEVVGPTNNNSDIDARDGALLRFRSTGLDNNSGAQLAITSGIVDVFGAVDNNSGAQIVVGGEATAVFHDPVTNNGQLFIQPGGEVLMLEDLGFGAGASLSIQLEEVDLTDEGAEPSDGFGQVQTSGAANLGGTLAVSLAGGFLPQAGDAFQIITAADGVSGSFTTEMLPALGGGLSFDVQYNPNSVVLAVIGAGLAGDYNQNGVVDAADYTVWQDTFGATVAAGTGADGDSDGMIDPGDYTVWKANFGNTAGSGATRSASAAVPEPSATALFAGLFLAGIVMDIRRRCPAIKAGRP